jgi:hypothetical protein
MAVRIAAGRKKKPNGHQYIKNGGNGLLGLGCLSSSFFLSSFHSSSPFSPSPYCHGTD